MFDSLKVKLLKNGKIQKVRLLTVLQDHEDRIRALEGEEPIPKPTGVVSITLVDCVSKEALAGAKITIDGETRTTGSAGGCSFNLTYGTLYNVSGEYNGEDLGTFAQIEPTEEEHEFELCLRID